MTLARDWSQCGNLYLLVFADCIPVKGAFNSALYDLTRNEITTFPTQYYFLLEELHERKVADFLEKIQQSADEKQILAFLDFLDENEAIMLVDDPKAFPRINSSWEFPGVIQNAIIDVATQIHDFQKIFGELDKLGCQYIEIRGFSTLLSLANSDSILEAARHKSIVSVGLILNYEGHVLDEEYISFVKRHPLITAFTIHSAPGTRKLSVDDLSLEQLDGAPIRQIRFTTQKITSEIHCGIINQQFLTVPTPESFFETHSFNGCLNQKIAVDKNGDIKNCPSMNDSYGNMRDVSLSKAADAPGLRAKWGLSKDQISVCRDCEFRYACSDCRAYLDNPKDLLSKPLKCGYDVYSGKWNNWGEIPEKRSSAQFYGIDLHDRDSLQKTYKDNVSVMSEG